MGQTISFHKFLRDKKALCRATCFPVLFCLMAAASSTISAGQLIPRTSSIVNSLGNPSDSLNSVVDEITTDVMRTLPGGYYIPDILGLELRGRDSGTTSVVLNWRGKMTVSDVLKLDALSFAHYVRLARSDTRLSSAALSVGKIQFNLPLWHARILNDYRIIQEMPRARMYLASNTQAQEMVAMVDKHPTSASQKLIELLSSRPDWASGPNLDRSSFELVWSLLVADKSTDPDVFAAMIKHSSGNSRIVVPIVFDSLPADSGIWEASEVNDLLKNCINQLSPGRATFQYHAYRIIVRRVDVESNQKRVLAMVTDPPKHLMSSQDFQDVLVISLSGLAGEPARSTADKWVRLIPAFKNLEDRAAELARNGLVMLDKVSPDSQQSGAPSQNNP